MIEVIIKTEDGGEIGIKFPRVGGEDPTFKQVVNHLNQMLKTLDKGDDCGRFDEEPVSE